MKNLFPLTASHPLRPRPARPLAALALLLAAAGAAQGQTPASFAPVSTYSAGPGSQPYGVAVADVNGDGRPDLVTANGNSSAAGVLLGLAGGGFAPISTYSTGAGSRPYGVAVADVNGDGRPDLVTANGNSSAAGVLLGLASGGFAPVSTYPVGIGSTPGIAVADVNGDGRLDLVTADGNGNTVSVLLGQAGGGFAAVSTYSTRPNSLPDGVAVVDVNGDGRPDIVTANYGSGTAGVLLQLPGGGFAAVSTYSTGTGSRPYSVAVADVNGDNRPDLVTANTTSNTVGVLLGLASGGFAPVSVYPTGTGSNPSGVAVADVNGDGRLDIIIANPANNTVGVLLGQVGGSFASVSTYSAGAGSGPVAVAVADVNGDGRPDLVTANISDSMAGVLLNTGTFTPLAAAPAAIVAEEAALFPNPARGGFAVQLPAGWGAAPVWAELRNALGQVVVTRAFSGAGGAALAFATEGLAPGVYVLRVQAGGHALVKRLVLD